LIYIELIDYGQVTSNHLVGGSNPSGCTISNRINMQDP